MEKQVDFLIIGSGIAGLSFALKVADFGSVYMITKSSEDESNTKYAQGGIAAVMHAPDTFEKHIQDTLNCGDGLCKEQIVRMVVEESTTCIEELIAMGAQFDKNEQGEYDLAREGGHSEHRVLHYKDATGFEIERVLLEKAKAHRNITLLTHHFAIDLLTEHHLGQRVTRMTPEIHCFGAYVLDEKTGQISTVLAKVTLMASGGAGHVYRVTTNPTIATGDGIAMVYRAKGTISNMEFYQFHPTALYDPAAHPSFLISEAVRGFGAILRNSNKEEFMHKYDARLSLAPRDITARAIDNELKISGSDYVYLDCRHLDQAKFEAHFPTITAKVRSLGIDLTKDMIPVAPAAHYMCGGIEVDAWGRSSITNLYAVGECSSTGLHGANRLASNSLLEAAVFASRASKDAIQRLKVAHFQKGIPQWNAEGTEAPEEMILITQNLREVQNIMTYYVGIVRSDLRLQRAFDRLEIIYKENEALYNKITVSTKVCELRNLITIAYLILKAAMDRKENKGLHYNVDLKNKSIPINVGY